MTISKPIQRFSSRLRLRMLSAVMGVGLLFNAAPSHAIFGVGDIVFDPGQFYEMVAEWYEQGQEFYKTAEHYKAQIKSYQAQIAKLTNIAYSLGIKPGQKLDPVDPDYLVAERCGAGKGLLGSLNPLNFGPNDDIQQQQLGLCASIQMMHNRKYNDTVTFLAENQKAMIDDFDQLQNGTSKVETVGDSNRAAQIGLRMTAKMEARIRDYETKMKAYDSYIASLENNQRVLAKTALKGQKSNQLLGTLVKTVTLKTALGLGSVDDAELKGE